MRRLFIQSRWARSAMRMSDSRSTRRLRDSRPRLFGAHGSSSGRDATPLLARGQPMAREARNAERPSTCDMPGAQVVQTSSVSSWPVCDRRVRTRAVWSSKVAVRPEPDFQAVWDRTFVAL